MCKLIAERQSVQSELRRTKSTDDGTVRSPDNYERLSGDSSSSPVGTTIARPTVIPTSAFAAITAGSNSLNLRLSTASERYSDLNNSLPRPSNSDPLGLNQRIYKDLNNSLSGPSNGDINILDIPRDRKLQIQKALKFLNSELRQPDAVISMLRFLLKQCKYNVNATYRKIVEAKNEVKRLGLYDGPPSPPPLVAPSSIVAPPTIVTPSVATPSVVTQSIVTAPMVTGSMVTASMVTPPLFTTYPASVIEQTSTSSSLLYPPLGYYHYPFGLSSGLSGFNPFIPNYNWPSFVTMPPERSLETNPYAEREDTDSDNSSNGLPSLLHGGFLRSMETPLYLMPSSSRQLQEHRL